MCADQYQWLEQVISEKGNTQDALIPVLLAVQHKYNYLPADVIDEICSQTHITHADIMEVATFYDQFRLTPAGKHTIKVCIGTACHVKGSTQVFESFKHDLNISEDEDTDSQKLFTVEKVACLGCCMMAVAVQIDDVIYGWVRPGKTQNIINDFLASQKDKGVDKQYDQLDAPAEVRMCLCSSCQAAGAEKVYSEIKRCAVKHKIIVKPMDVGCTGMSFQAPFLQVIDSEQNIFNYAQVDEEAVSSILFHHFKPRSFDRIFDRLLGSQSDPVWRYRVESIDMNQPWHTLQKRITTEHCGEVSPSDINAYMDRKGFEGLKRALTLSPEKIIDEVSFSGLRGRGGAGFPTAAKWFATAQSHGDHKYVVCNADEGDPGAFMDRMLLESFPFRIIEGMAVAARAIGAEQGFVFVRAEYPLAILRLRHAVKMCEQSGILGKNILNSGFSFNIKIMEGAGAFVCGEETALIAAMQGHRGVPKRRPPYPSEKGYKGHPTLINNVETFASIPWIFINGAKAYSRIGADRNSGTKTFALAGKIERGGLVEVPLGTKLRTIIEDIGGGVANGRKLKAVQIGGPSGGCLPEELLGLAVDYEALASVGSMMGSGGLVVLDEHDCIVDIARYFLTFTVAESCGKCTFCRIGLQRMLDILNRICSGRGVKDDLKQLEILANDIRQGSLCGLGRTAPNPVLSTLKYFYREYEEHLQGRCPAGKCQDLFSFQMNQNCIGCMICSRSCPVQAIAFDPWNQAQIDQEKCIRCGVCRTNCPENAIEVAP